MNCSWNSETVGTSFFAATAGATLARMVCAARSSAYRCVLALPFTGDFFRSSKRSPFGRTSLRWYSQPSVLRAQEGPQLRFGHPSTCAIDVTNGLT